MEAGLALHEAQRQRAPAVLYGHAPGVVCRSYLAWLLWLLGYPKQALQWSRDNLDRARARPFSLTHALSAAASLQQCRREGRLAQEQAEAMMAIASEHGFPFFSARGAMLRGWALAAQGQGETGVAQLHEGLAAHRATETTLGQPYFLALVAEAWAWVGQADAGLHALDEALAATHQTGERLYEAELHRLKGELLLQSSVRSPTSNVETRVLDTPPGASEAETCFRQALDVARRQQARSLELRTALSLSRLWQQQSKRTAAHDLLAPIYGWFTEGFDTADLQEAKALLEDLGT